MLSSNGESDTYWRYQATWEEDEDGDKVFSVIEVYIRDGVLNSWTEPTRCAGESWAQLLSDLQRRQEDCRAYRPVAYADLVAGMMFERITYEQTDPTADR